MSDQNKNAIKKAHNEVHEILSERDAYGDWYVNAVEIASMANISYEQFLLVMIAVKLHRACATVKDPSSDHYRDSVLDLLAYASMLRAYS